MPERDLRVIKPCVGGGFGGKSEVFPLDLCCALLSKKSGKPVKICHTREEEFTASKRRHPLEIELKIGLKGDGTIISRQAKIILDGGAYNSCGPAAVNLAGLFLTITYRQPNIKIESCRVYTNKTPCAAMRGFTSPQMFLASELQMDMAADEMGMDPVDLRMKNGTRTGDITVNGLRIKSGSLQACLEKVAESSEWKKKYKKLLPLQGIGVAASGFISGDQYPLLGPYTASSNIFVKADPDGTVAILAGVSDIGQGSDTVLSQIVAEVLGISVQDVRITSPDTDLSPLDSLTAGARVTFMAGNATKRAAFDLKQKLFKAVSEKLEARAEDLEAKDQRIYVRGSPEKEVSFRDAVIICQTAHKGMATIGEGVYTPPPGVAPDVVTGYGDHSPSYKYTAVVAEVEVDRETGSVKVNKISFCDDCGRVINLLGVAGQLEGATAMGLGYALYEDLVVKEGKTLNPCFLEYMMPTTMEMPEMENLIVESNDPEGPFGAKEGAEGTVGPVAPAILNAIYNATGIRFKQLPVTPEMLLSRLKSNKTDHGKKGGE